MSYTRTVWSTGDIISANGLNNIEEGIIGLETAAEDIRASVAANTALINDAKAILEDSELNPETTLFCSKYSEAGGYAKASGNVIWLNGSRSSGFRRLFLTDDSVYECANATTDSYPLETAFTRKLVSGHTYKIVVIRKGTPTDDTYTNNFNVGTYGEWSDIVQFGFEKESENVKSETFVAGDVPIIINMFVRSVSFDDLRFIYWIEDVTEEETYKASVDTLSDTTDALDERITSVERNKPNADAVAESAVHAVDVPAALRAANVFPGISESITRRTLTVSPYGWSSVWLAGTIPAAGSTYSQLIPFTYTFNAGQTYTIYVTGQSEITGLLVRPYGENYVKQGGNTVSGIVNGGAVNFVPDETITVDYINLWHGAGLVAEDTAVAGELFIMIVPGAYITTDFSLSSVVNGIPRYWDSALDTAIAKIQALDGETGTHGDSFVFVTDYHIPDNANHSAALIKEIVASTAVDKVFYGGDTLNAQTAKVQAYALHRKFWRQFDGLRVFPIYGNHDNNDNSKRTEEDILTYNEVYSLFGKRVEKYGINTTISPDTHNEDSLIGDTEITWRERWGHTEPLGSYYYYDNVPQKIRYIVLNGFFVVKAGDQGTWFRNTLNATAAGWTIVVLCHAWWKDAARTEFTATTGSLKNALDAYIKGGGAAKVACWIAGHLHYDYSEMIDTVVTSGDDAGKTYSFPVIITTCDSYLNDTTNMTLGTATEQAFDVVHIDTYNQTIKCTRVGAGEDRLEYSYGYVAAE